ncbi:LOW QUALITY PROTEIN: macrophage colony-stimulating factor 1 [Echinops telfairi]|uniref:LOW QUALITY PROTEIN: macrophage colony-stimulating factor 1 n=1 Tax=Echinops telfairi TaxID=9371 RepID=A0AC55D8L6_ECHTE|nr:LOW QUALITY PROTEIN: macrophage colony-stimulating factor 1 [Echinops telfairi]
MFGHGYSQACVKPGGRKECAQEEGLRPAVWKLVHESGPEWLGVCRRRDRMTGRCQSCLQGFSCAPRELDWWAHHPRCHQKFIGVRLDPGESGTAPQRRGHLGGLQGCANAVRKSERSWVPGSRLARGRSRLCRIMGLRFVFCCPPRGLGALVGGWGGGLVSWEEMTPSLSQAWLGPWLLLASLLVSRSVPEKVPGYCKDMITNGHLTILQHLIDSQMQTSCQIAFEFVDRDQLNDPVCFLKKAFLLVQDILEDTLRFKDNTPNANATVQLQELSLRLKHCFTTDHEEQGKACVRTFNETPLQLLEKIKNVFNETKQLLQDNGSVFSKDCKDSFAKCSGQDVVTKPDCNCLYPKASPSSDLASASPHQPLAPSVAPMAALSWADSEGVEGSSSLPSEQALQAVDPGNAKQRPPRSTCQSLGSPETAGVEGSPPASSLPPHASAGGPSPGMDGVLDPLLGTNWAPEESSGEANEGPAPQGAESTTSRSGEGSIQAESARPSEHLLVASPPAGAAEAQEPADSAGPPLPSEDPALPVGQAWTHTPEKTDRTLALPRDHQTPGSPRTLTPRPQGLSSLSTLSPQPSLPRSPSGGNMLPLGELEGKRSTRDRRSPTELEGGRASEGAARPQARFNPVPLTDAGHERQRVGPSDPKVPGFVFRLLVPSIILVLLAVGGLLFYRRRRRGHRELQAAESPLEQPEGSPLTQDEDKQMELPV